MRHLHQDFELKKKGRIMGITGNEQGSTEDTGEKMTARKDKQRNVAKDEKTELLIK